MDLLISVASQQFSERGMSPGLSLIQKYYGDRSGVMTPQSSIALGKIESVIAVESICVPSIQQSTSTHGLTDHGISGETATSILTSTSAHNLAQDQADDVEVQPNPLQDDTVLAETVAAYAEAAADGSTIAANKRTNGVVPSADDIIGIRPPRNVYRTKSTAAYKVGETRCTDMYKRYCNEYKVKSNSRVIRILHQHETNTQTPANPFEDLTSLDVSLCMLRDRGLLPVLEVARHCVNLRSLNLAGNDITNEGVEFLAHAVVEGCASSSFEIIEIDENNKRQNDISAHAQEVNMINLRTNFCACIASLDVSDNLLSLGGLRLLQLIAEKLPTLVEIKVVGARVDANELQELEKILAENRSFEG